jgi:hypothetical protein
MWLCRLETLQWLSFEDTTPFTPMYPRHSGIFRRVGDVSGDIGTSASISSVRVQGRLCSDWVTLKIKEIRSSLSGNTVSHSTRTEDSAKPLSELQILHIFSLELQTDWVTQLAWCLDYRLDDWWIGFYSRNSPFFSDTGGTFPWDKTAGAWSSPFLLN